MSLQEIKVALDFAASVEELHDLTATIVSAEPQNVAKAVGKADMESIRRVAGRLNRSANDFLG